MIHLALVEPSARSRAELRKMIDGTDWIFVETECHNYEEALTAIGKPRPDGLLLGIDDDPKQAFQLIVQMLQKYPRLAIMVISSRPELLVQAHRLGAKSLLESPVQLEDLLGALKNLSAGTSLQRPPEGRVIAVLASRGGVGCTSLAVNLGCTLATEPGNEVVLLDLDFFMGTAAIALDLSPKYRLHEVVATLEGIDIRSLKDFLCRHETGLALLPGPERLADVPLIKPEHIDRLIILLRILSSHVILDLSKGWDATDLQGMQLADAILLVIQPELCSLRNATLMLKSLAAEGLEGKVKVVMNRVGADFGSGTISLKKAEDCVGRPLQWQLPSDPKAMMDAWAVGVPLILHAPRSKIQQSIAGLAADLRLHKTEPRRTEEPT